MALGQEEGLRYLTFAVDAGEVEPGIHAVFGLAGIHKPVAVFAPVVETLCPAAVQCLEFLVLTGLEIHEPQVGIILTDREVATTAHTVHQPAPVVTGSDEGVTLVGGWPVQQCIDGLSESATLRIEGNPAQAALHFLILGWHPAGLGGAVVEPLAVVGEGGEYLQVLCLQQGRQDEFIASGVEHLHVAEPVVDLDALAGADEEGLMHGVDGHRTVVTVGMPVTV